jgi:hypothetical protein
MENLEFLLRDEFERPTEHARESVNDLIANTRRIRRRRSIGSSAGAFVAVVAVAAMVTTVVNANGPSRGIDAAHRPHGTPTTIDPSAFDRLGEALSRDPGLPAGGGMVDSQHGFLLLMRCTDAQTLTTCVAHLDATTDGGATFTQRPPLPLDTSVFGMTQLYVFDADHLVLDQPAAIDISAYTANGGPDGPPLPSGFPSDFRSGFPSDFPSGFPSDFASGYPIDPPSGIPPSLPAPQRWASADGGRTWQSVSIKPAGTVATIPLGDQLDIAGGMDGVITKGTPATDVYAMSPSGRTYTLAGAPVASSMDTSDAGPGAALTRPINGSYFLNNVTGDDSLMVSTDQGATWHPVHMPDKDGELSLLGGDGTRIYGELSSGGDAPDSLVVSIDGGLTWKRLPLPPLTPVATSSPNPGASDDGGPDSSSDFLSMAVLPGGGLLLSDTAQLWRLPAGGQAFQRVDEDVATLGLLGFMGKVLAFRGDPTHATAYVTTDGIHWTKSKIG